MSAVTSTGALCEVIRQALREQLAQLLNGRRRDVPQSPSLPADHTR